MIPKKLGDKCRLLKNDNGYRIGEIVYLAEEDCRIPFVSFSHEKAIKRQGDGCVSLENLELIEDKPTPKFKVGDRVRIENKPVLWASKLSDKNPFSLTYPKEFVIEEIEVCESYTAMRASGYGFDLYSLIEKNNIELVEEGCGSCEVDEELDNLLEEANESTNNSKNKVGKIMSKVSEFVKNSLLSKEEKLLRKYGLKDSCGDYTDEAERLVISKLVKENEEYLVGVAKDLEVEEKANK